MTPTPSAQTWFRLLKDMILNITIFLPFIPAVLVLVSAVSGTLAPGGGGAGLIFFFFFQILARISVKINPTIAGIETIVIGRLPSKSFSDPI